MNPKLRDLQIQAFAECKSFEDGHFKTDEVFERFAELIVQECARISRATPCPYTDELMRQQLGHTWDMASSEAGREIMQHFGVEEPKGWVCSKCGTDRTKAVCPKGHTAALTGDCPMVGVAL